GDNYYEAGETVPGSFATFVHFASPSSSAQPPDVMLHVAQASLESNGNHDYLVQAIPAGVGAVWADNLYAVYQSGIGFGSWRPVPLLPPVPGNPSLAGSNGVFLPDPIPPNQVLLNLPMASCSSTP
ncbi:MAG: hypothetical protein JSS28_09160, partial [Proteobacteria bacterium]|nr:hypothetical protein [Pseudomonadota bacterium]